MITSSKTVTKKTILLNASLRRRQQTVLEEGNCGVLRLGRAEGAYSRGTGADELDHDRHQ